jgi:hypothetical protein
MHTGFSLRVVSTVITNWCHHQWRLITVARSRTYDALVYPHQPPLNRDAMLHKTFHPNVNDGWRSWLEPGPAATSCGSINTHMKRQSNYMVTMHLATSNKTHACYQQLACTLTAKVAKYALNKILIVPIIVTVVTAQAQLHETKVLFIRASAELHCIKSRHISVWLFSCCLQYHPPCKQYNLPWAADRNQPWGINLSCTRLFLNHVRYVGTATC